VLKSRLKLPGAVLEVPSAQEPCSRSFRVILCRLSVMGAGCAKRATGRLRGKTKPTDLCHTRLFPVLAGAALAREVRSLHGGTNNLV